MDKKNAPKSTDLFPNELMVIRRADRDNVVYYSAHEDAAGVAIEEDNHDTVVAVYGLVKTVTMNVNIMITDLDVKPVK